MLSVKMQSKVSKRRKHTELIHFNIGALSDNVFGNPNQETEFKAPNQAEGSFSNNHIQF